MSPASAVRGSPAPFPCNSFHHAAFPAAAPLFWSFRYGYATLLESWRHSLPHVQPADPAGRRCRVAVLPPAAQSPGRKPRPDRASLSFGVLGALVGAKFLLPAAQLPQLLQDLPVGGRSGRLFRPLPLGGFVFMAGCSALWPRFGCSAGGARSPFPNWGRPGPRRPLFHTFGRVGCFLAGCCYGIPAPAGWPGVTFRVSPVAPQRRGAPPPSSCMRPPAACSSLCCCTAWPGGAGRGGPFAGLSGRLRPVPLRPGISSGRCRPGVGGIFHLSAAGSGYSGRCPPPPDPPSPYVRQTAAPVTYRPRLFFVSAPPPPLHQEPASWNRLSKSYVRENPERLHPRGNLLGGHRLLLQKPAGQLLAYIRGVVDVVAVLVQVCNQGLVIHKVKHPHIGPAD